MSEGRPLQRQYQIAEIARFLGRAISQQAILVQFQLAKDRILHAALNEGVVQHRQPSLHNADAHPFLAIGIALQEGRLIEVFAFYLGLQNEIADFVGIIRLVDQAKKVRPALKNRRTAAFKGLPLLIIKIVFDLCSLLVPNDSMISV